MPYIGNIVQDFSVNNAMLNTDSVTSIKIDDGTIVNADISDSAAIAVSKLSGVLPLAGGTLTGNLTISNSAPSIALIDTDSESDFSIFGSQGEFRIRDQSNTTNRLTITSDGKVNFGSVARVEADGTFKAPHGDEATPAYNFLNDNDNGMFRATTNTIGFSTGGTERMRINSSGRVGLGTTNPDSRLHLSYDSGDSQIRLTRSNSASNTNDYGRLLWESSSDVLTGKIAVARESGEDNGYMHFSTASGGTLSERMRIDSSGRVLIGTTTLGEGSADNLTVADSGHCGVTIRSGSSSGGNLFFTDVTSDQFQGFVQYNHSSNHLGLGTNKLERMRIDSSGNVGIGTLTPASLLELASHRNAETDKFSAANYHLHLRNTENDNGEAIGISFAITSDETAVGAAILHERDAGGSQGSLQFLTNSNGSSVTERMRIRSGGQINIGDDLTQTDRTVSIHGGSNVGQLQLKGTEADLWLHSTGANKIWRILGSTGANTHRFRIYDNSNSKEPFFIEGSSGTNTSHVHINSGNLKFDQSGTGIDFHNFGTGTNISSNTLDDYEEGTWTPALSFSSTNNAASFDIQQGMYRKIGSLVFVAYALRSTNFNGSSGAVRISGLPFSSTNTPIANISTNGVFPIQGVSFSGEFISQQLSGTLIELYGVSKTTSGNNYNSIGVSEMNATGFMFIKGQIFYNAA